MMKFHWFTPLGLTRSLTWRLVTCLAMSVGILWPAAAQSPSPVPPQASLGVQVSQAFASGYAGLQIAGFDPRSLLDDAGLMIGDVLVMVEGNRVESLADAAEAMRNLQPGQRIEVQLFRDGQLFRVDVPLIERRSPASPADEMSPPMAAGDTRGKSPADRASLGIEVVEAAAARGVFVRKANPESAGGAAGLLPGDRLVAIDGRILRVPDDLIREVTLRRPADRVTLGVVRGSALLEVEVTLGGADGLATEPPDMPSTEDESVEEVGGLLGGVGSMLGGLLGNRSEPKPSTAESLPAESRPDKKIDEPTPADPLALPDEPNSSGPETTVDPAEARRRIAELEAEITRLKQAAGLAE